MPTVWNVEVPFEPFVHASLESTIQAELPNATLRSDLQITRTGPIYVASVKVVATGPHAAKVAAVDRVESFLKVLATWNDGFTVEMSRIRATPAEESQQSGDGRGNRDRSECDNERDCIRRGAPWNCQVKGVADSRG